MGASVRLASGLKPLKGLSVFANGSLRTIKNGYVRTASGLEHFFGSFSVSLSSTTARGGAYRTGGDGSITTTPVTALVSGGNGPFTYSWARTDAGSDPFLITAPGAATTSFQSSPAENTLVSATFACTVTDAAGAVLTTPNVDVWIKNISIGTGGTL